MDVYAIMGMIGVGKSTLCADAEKHDAGVAVFNEYVCDTFLAAYVADPVTYAFALQMTMLQSAFVRTDMALRVVARPCVIERPLFENIVFARANLTCGYLTLPDYTQYVRHMHRMYRDMATVPTSTYSPVYLWAREQQTLDNMLARQRLSESDYDDRYLQTLAHGYFLSILELYIRNEGSSSGDGSLGLPLRPSVEPLPPSPVVVDWNAFGTWRTLSVDQLTAERRAWTRQAGTITFVDDEDGRGGGGGGGSGVASLDRYLRDWAQRETPEAARRCRAFRDDFFACRARMMPQTLHVGRDTRARLVQLLDYYAASA